MFPPPEFLLPLQIFSALILAVLMVVATIVWYFLMRNVGGIAGNYFTLFFTCIAMYGVSIPLTISASSEESAIVWGAIGLINGVSGWFFLFLAGEYSTTARPPPIRVMAVGTFYGISLGGFIFTFVNPISSGLVYVTYVPTYGWVIHVAPVFIMANLIAPVLFYAFFLLFAVKAFRAAPNTTFGRNIRKLLVALSIGLAIDVTVIGLGWIFYDFAIFSPVAAMFVTIIFIILAFLLLFRNYRIIYFLPHKAIGIILMSTSGIVCFDHKFQKDIGTHATRDLLGPALNAVNNIVQETLELTTIEWIREFRTNKMTFLLDVRAQYDIVGLLVVTNSTQILQTALSKFMNGISTLCVNSKGELCDTPEKEKHIRELCMSAFPFIPPID